MLACEKEHVGSEVLGDCERPTALLSLTASCMIWREFSSYTAHSRTMHDRVVAD